MMNVVTAINSGNHAPWTSFVRFAARKEQIYTQQCRASDRWFRISLT
jgi:hypothetical protein